MQNEERVKIIQFHNNQLGFDCPCVLRASGKIEVHDTSRMPENEAVLDQWKTEMLNHLASTEYINKRVEEYPPIGNQLDYIYHNGLTAWKNDMITPVKQKYPKP